MTHLMTHPHSAPSHGRAGVIFVGGGASVFLQVCVSTFLHMLFFSLPFLFLLGFHPVYHESFATQRLFYANLQGARSGFTGNVVVRHYLLHCTLRWVENGLSGKICKVLLWLLIYAPLRPPNSPLYTTSLADVRDLLVIWLSHVWHRSRDSDYHGHSYTYHPVGRSSFFSQYNFIFFFFWSSFFFSFLFLFFFWWGGVGLTSLAYHHMMNTPQAVWACNNCLPNVDGTRSNIKSI